MEFYIQFNSPTRNSASNLSRQDLFTSFLSARTSRDASSGALRFAQRAAHFNASVPQYCLRGTDIPPTVAKYGLPTDDRHLWQSVE